MTDREHARTRTAHEANELRALVRTNDAAIVRNGSRMVAISALCMFAIQAWFTYGFAYHVWGLPFALAFGSPVALDAYVVTLMFIAFHMRGARWYVAAWIWVLLCAGVGAQMAASEAFAVHLGMGAAGRVASLLPAPFLAGALHALILLGRQHPAVRRPAEALPRTAAPRPAKPATRPAEVPAFPPLTAVPSPARRGTGRRPDHRQPAALARVDNGEPAAAVARSMGLSPRTVQVWVDKANRSGAPPAATESN